MVRGVDPCRRENLCIKDRLVLFAPGEELRSRPSCNEERWFSVVLKSDALVAALADFAVMTEFRQSMILSRFCGPRRSANVIDLRYVDERSDVLVATEPLLPSIFFEKLDVSHTFSRRF